MSSNSLPRTNANSAKIMMKVLEKGEVFSNDENPTFERTDVICEHKDVFFIAHMPCRMTQVPNELEMSSELDSFLIRPQDIYPRFDAKSDFMCVSPDQISDLHLKQQRLLGYTHGNGSEKALLLQEAGVLEELNKLPHPNIARYCGCLVRNGMIVGLCFEKYSETLRERAKRIGSGLRIAECIAGIRKGIDHLHSNGYCHNDINPANIMFRNQDNTPIVIDFDSCLPIDQKLTLKWGTPGYADERATHSKPENDLFSLRLVEQFLRKCAEPKSTS